MLPDKSQYDAVFEAEFYNASLEVVRLEQLLKDVYWYNFEVACRTWKSPWRHGKGGGGGEGIGSCATALLVEDREVVAPPRSLAIGDSTALGIEPRCNRYSCFRTITPASLQTEHAHVARRARVPRAVSSYPCAIFCTPPAAARVLLLGCSTCG